MIEHGKKERSLKIMSFNKYFFAFNWHLRVSSMDKFRTVHTDSTIWTILAFKMRKWFPNIFESLYLHITSDLMELYCNRLQAEPTASGSDSLSCMGQKVIMKQED